MITTPAYTGRIPACGVYCGTCPVFTRDRNPCPGAEVNRERCEKCKSFHLCCEKRGIEHCYECKAFPCSKLKNFSKRWEKYGQVIVENQHLLREVGVEEFRSTLSRRKRSDS